MLESIAIFLVNFDFKSNRKIWFSLLFLQLLVLFLFFLGYKYFSFLPVYGIVFLIGVFHYELSLYLLILSMFVHLTFHLGIGWTVFSFGIFILLSAHFLRNCFTTKLVFPKTSLDKPILIFLFVLGISLINAVDLKIGIITYIWHIQTFLVFYLLVAGIKSEKINKLLLFFLGLAVLSAVYNLFEFFSAGGRIRAMGITGVPSSGLFLTALLVCSSFYLFEKKGTRKFYYLISFFVLAGGLFATKTRGAIFSMAISLLFLILLSFKKAKKEKLRKVYRNLWLISFAILLVVLLFLFLFPFYAQGLSHRIYLPYGKPIDTTQIRLFLWGLSLNLFWENPVLGAGIGQFYKVAELIPELKFSLLAQHIIGLDPHNMVLYYLSQTGILGLMALFYLMFSFFKVGWRKFKDAKKDEEIAISLVLLSFFFHVISSSFYAGEWYFGIGGVQLALFLALLVVFQPNKNSIH
jgi:O-antigen ligase